MFGFFRKKKNESQPAQAAESRTDEAKPSKKGKRSWDEFVDAFSPNQNFAEQWETITGKKASDDEISDAERSRIQKALFPRTLDMLHAVKKELEENHTVFPASVDDVAPGTPTMDSVTQSGNVANLGKGLHGAIGKGAKPLSRGMSQQGKNSALEANGISMMPDPLNRFPINPRVLKHFQSRVWITYSGCAIIATHEFVNRACMIPAEDAIAHGYKVVCVSHKHEHTQKHDENEAKFLENVKKAADTMGLNDDCVKLNYKKKVFGVAVAIPRVKFKENYLSPTDTSGNTPYSYADAYDPKAIAPHSFEGFAVIDPHWLTYKWDDESATDPTSVHFLEPTWIEVGTKKIHRSWVIRVVNSEIPDILKPAYYYGGLSLCQMIYERVWCADKIANEAPLLAMTKRLLIADGNLEQMISDARHTNIFFKAINYFRDNFSIFVKKPSSNVTQLDTNLTELTSLTMVEYQLVAAIAQMPVTKLLKNVPTGLQSTGDYEWDDYAQSLHVIQERDYTPLCRKFYELYVASEYPDKTDIHLDIEWNPIDVPKEKELVQMASSTAQFVAHLQQTHMITVGEGRNILRKSGNPIFQSLATAIPDLLTKIEDANDPAQQQAGVGQMADGGQPGEQTPQISQEDEQIKKNDEIFKQALEKVLGKKEADNALSNAISESLENPQEANPELEKTETEQDIPQSEDSEKQGVDDDARRSEDSSN